MTMDRDDVESRLGSLERRVELMEGQLKQNTEVTNQIKSDTAQLLTLFKASQLGAAIVKWCATVGGGAIVAYAAFKGVGSIH